MCKYTTFCLSIHLLGNTGVVSNLTIMNNADRDFCVQVLSGYKFPVLMGVGLGVVLLGQKACITFRGIAKLFPKVTAPFYIPARSGREFRFLHVLTNARFRKIFVLAYEECVFISQNLFQRIGRRDVITIFFRGGEKWSLFPSADSFSKPWPLYRVGFQERDSL